MKHKQVIVGIAGSIAAYKACDVIRQLQKARIGVDVVMTKEAAEFITPLTLQALTDGKVYYDIFRAPLDYDAEHIALAKKAEAIVIAPATANIIGKIANGIYDDLLTCVVAASKAPVIIAPAMNTGMYENAVVQNNIRTLKRLGMRFVGPRQGKLACGDNGIGCLEEIDTIVRCVRQALRLR